MPSDPRQAKNKNSFEGCTTVEEVIAQAIGAGSTCWESLSGTGEFQSGLAHKFVNDAVERIEEIEEKWRKDCFNE